MYHERGEYAVGADVEFDETKKATVLKCDVHDAIRESDGEYYATFKWLLSPLGLSFIENKFEESKGGLSWDGEVGGIPTSITIKLPPQESVYAAWERLPSPGHCHGHVWWTMPVPLPSPVITPTPTPPGFEAIFTIAGLLAVVYLLRRRK